MLISTIDEVFATVVVALIYLVVVRAVDVNEREPMWAVLLTFVLGGAGAGLLNLIVDPVTLNLGAWQGALLREVALFLAVGVAFQILASIGRLRGWSEVTDLVDGLIYGFAAGLGFTCGEAVATLDASQMVPFAVTGAAATIGRVALAGLAQGVFAAIVGAGLAVAVTRRTGVSRLLALAGLGLAIAVHGAHQVLAYGNALGGPNAVVRAQVALALPVLAVAALVVYGLARERRVIASQLAADPEAATAAERELLGHVPRRQGLYLRALLTGRMSDLRALSALHNRQVMLALINRRAGHTTDAAARHAALAEVEALRRGIRAARSHLDAARSGAGR